MSRAPATMNPFPGLRPFTQEEDYLFFGREEQTMELLQRLGGNRFVAVVGSSGSGKSSLVRCGLLSQLLGGKLLEAGASWEIAVTHPGGNPLALLTDALLEADLYDRDEENARENLLATLSRSHFGLVEAVKQADLGAGTNFLLVVDQFEEIFRFHEAGQTQQEAANEFVSLLLEAAAQKEVPIYVVLTMRSDFIGECGQFEGLAEMVNRGEYLIPRLNREQFKRVIEGPIKVASGQIAPRLLQRLLNDLGQQADQLPCLQHALMRTWNVWSEKGDTDALDLDDYQRVGKMSLALSLHADEIYESLASDRQRALCQGIFQALTVEASNSRGIRRPQRLGRLCQILDAPADDLRPIIDAYRQSGVTFLMPSPEVELTDQTILDISHESLMRVWTRLRQWVEEETQAAGIYHRLSESADLHERGKAGLYRDPELGIALAWRDAKRPNAAWAERYRPGFAAAIAFLEASQRASVAEEQSREAARQRELQQAQQLAEAQQLRLEHQQRSARKLRVMIAGLAAVALIAILACVAALFANQRAMTLAVTARQNEEKARQNATRAEQSQQEAAKALGVVASQKREVEGSLSKAEEAERLARAAEEAGRKLLYTTDMRLAPFVWKDPGITAEQLRVLLAKHIPEETTKDEAGRMNETAPGSGPSAISHPASFVKPDLRGFEWRYFQYLLEHSAAVFAGHTVAVEGAAFASDGQLVTLDQSGQLRRWDVDSQHEDEPRRRDLPGGAGAQLRVLSPGGRLAALAIENKVHVFETSTGKEAFSIDSANDRDRRLIFSPDSEKLVVVDARIRWCNTSNGGEIASLDQKLGHSNSLALSADGLTLSVVGLSSLGQKFSTFRLDPNAKSVTPLLTDAGGNGTKAASELHPDGKLLAVSYLQAAVGIFETATGRQIARNGSAHPAPIVAMAFSGDGTKLATADQQGTIKIWADPEKLTSASASLRTLKGHGGAITSVGFSTDGKRLVTTGADKTARVWELETPDPAVRRLERYGAPLNIVARFSPDGQLIASSPATGLGGRNVFLWDAATGRLLRDLRIVDAGWRDIYSVAFSPTDSRLLAVGCGGPGDSSVSLWDIDAGTELARLPAATNLTDLNDGIYTGAVGALAFSPDGKYLVAGFGQKHITTRKSSPNPVKVWKVATRQPIQLLNGHTGYCTSLAFSKDGTLLASGSRDGTAIVWSTATWKPLQTLENRDRGTIDFDDYGGQNEAKPKFIEDVAFSPDGKTLAMASDGGTMLLWDVAAGKHLETLKGHSSTVRAVVFSPDGRTLASGSADQTVRLWNVETRRVLMQLDPGNVRLGSVQSLDFSPDGTQLLAAGEDAAVWSTAPIVWNDSERAAERLRLLLQSRTDFLTRIRMLPEKARSEATLEHLEKLAPNDQRVQTALAVVRARRLAAQGHSPHADAARIKARLLFEQRLAEEPENSAWAAELVDVLLLDSRARWTILEPTQMKSEGGATLTLLDDGSILAGGTNPDRDVYSLVATTDLKEINAIRLEALPDSSLPSGGPGRSANGNFNLNELQVHSGDRPAALKDIRVAYDEAEEYRNVIDGKIDETRGWSNHPRAGQANTALIATRIALAPKEDLRFQLVFSRVPQWKQNSLGRFRLSISGDPQAIEQESNRLAVMGLADSWAKLAAAYHLLGDQPALETLLKRHPEAARGIGELYAAAGNWERAVAEYTKAITPETKDAKLLAKRAEAYEKLERWDLATADWTRASQQQPDVAFERFKPAGAESWRLTLQNGGAGSMEVVDGTVVFTTTVATGTSWHVQPWQGPLQLENGDEYVIRFKMKSPDSCAVTLFGQVNQEDWHSIGLNETFVPPSEFRDYEFAFVAHDVVPRNNMIGFNLGMNRGKVMVKEIVILKK